MGRPRRHEHRPASPAELDAAARITPADVERAKLAWKRLAPGALRNVLDARPVTTKPPRPRSPRRRRAR